MEACPSLAVASSLETAALVHNPSAATRQL